MRKLILLLIDILILALPAWAQTTYQVTDYGAKGDGTTDDAPALQRAIDACSADGGGRVLLSRGRTFLSGPLQLKSGVELYPQFRNPTNSLRSLRSKPPRMRFLLFKLAFCHVLTDMIV